MSLNLNTNDIVSSISSSFGKNTWLTIAVIISVVVAVGGYIIFLRPNKKYGNKFVDWIKGFLNFDELVIEPLIKIVYIFATLFIILSSFSLLDYSFSSFLIYLVVGIISTRIAYEIVMIIVGIYKNTKK